MFHLILSLLAMAGIGALLALLLEIAASYLTDYGEKHILINEEKDLVVDGGSPLLFSLMEQGIFIPSACGGRGTCAYCKVKIHEGGGPVLPTETPYLDKEELKDHVRLSCQVKVKDDLKIEIPEEIFLIKEFKVRTTHITALTSNIKEINLDILSPEEGIKFKAGQYIQLRAPKYELTKQEEYRAYSIASPSDEHHQIGLIIGKVPGGAVSTYVHDYLKEGDEVLINGPYGEFYLRDSDRDILMIATGTGLAPIKSILHQMEKEQNARKITLFFGARTRKDLIHHEDLKQFEKNIPNLKFVPTLSRPTEEDQWDGELGRVTDLIQKHIPENADLDVYICGSPAMVQSCVEALSKKNIPRERILFDEFG